jgi:uncharacterized protein YjcR
VAKKLAKLNKQHLEAMRLRLQGMTYKQIAEKLNKSSRAIISWFCEDDLFKEEFEKMQTESVERARMLLVDYAPDAATNLIRLASGAEKGKGSKIMLDANIDILNRVGLKPVEKQEIDMKTDGVIRVKLPDDLK